MRARILNGVGHFGRILLCTVALYCAALISLRLCGFSYVSVASNSMAPVAVRGDLLLLSNRTPQAGSFVMFEHRGMRVVHRLVKKTPTGEWITRGDANAHEDPWRVDPKDIQGVAVGVIRGFGVPMLLHPRADAKFTRRETAPASATSTYWQQAAMSWNVIQNSGAISYRSPNLVTFAQSGNRKIWSTSSFPGAVHAHFYGRLSSTDFVQGGFTIITHACSIVSDSPNCGLAFTVNTNLKQIQLRTVAGDIFSKVLASAPFSVSFAANQHLAVYRSGNNVEVWLNGVSVIHIENLAQLMQANSANMPTGTICGLWLNGSNRVTDARVNFW